MKEPRPQSHTPQAYPTNALIHQTFDRPGVLFIVCGKLYSITEHSRSKLVKSHCVPVPEVTRKNEVQPKYVVEIDIAQERHTLL